MAAKSVVTSLVIGGNRGTGFALVQKLIARGDKVYATTRKPSEELDGLACEVITDIDVSEDTVVQALQEKTAGEKFDNVFVISGQLNPRRITPPLAEQMNILTLGPMRAYAGVTGCMAEGSKFGLITSHLGRICDQGTPGVYGYRTSTAALTTFGKTLAEDLKTAGVAVGVIHPEEEIVERMDELCLENSGSAWLPEDDESKS